MSNVFTGTLVSTACGMKAVLSQLIDSYCLRLITTVRCEMLINKPEIAGSYLGITAMLIILSVGFVYYTRWVLNNNNNVWNCRVLSFDIF